MTPEPPRSSSGSGRGASPGAKCDGRGIALQTNSLLRNSALCQASRLIEAQHFEAIDSTSPELREPQQQAKKTARASALGDQALRMEIRDAIDELLPEQEIERRNEMQHQRRTAGKEDRIRPPHRCKRGAQQQQVRDDWSRQAAPQISVSGRCGDGCGGSRASRRRRVPRPVPRLAARWSSRPASHPSLRSPIGARTEPHIVRPRRNPAAASRRCKRAASSALSDCQCRCD